MDNALRGWLWSLLVIAMMAGGLWEWLVAEQVPTLTIICLPGPLVAAGRAFGRARSASGEVH